MKLTAIAIALIAACSYVNAKADTTIYIGGWSKHTSSAHATNDNQAAVIVNYNNILAGRFTNSYGDATSLLGYEYKIDKLSSENWAVSVSPALTYGYEVCPGTGYQEYDDGKGEAKACAIAMASVKYTKYKVQPTLVFTHNAVSAMIAIKF